VSALDGALAAANAGHRAEFGWLDRVIDRIVSKSSATTHTRQRALL
jgi:hypothetical protein